MTTGFDRTAMAVTHALAVLALCACGGANDTAQADAQDDTAQLADADGTKHAAAAETAAVTWTKVAGEGQSVVLPAPATIRYGAGTAWVEKAVSGTLNCTNAFFGRDPIYGTVKSCESQVPASSTGTWAKVATEGQSLALPAPATIRYGAGSVWVEKAVTGTLACTNAFFGKDPIYGVVKACERFTPAAPPPPTAATACDTATGTVLQVGPGQTYAKPSAAAAVAPSGSVIRIAAGDYTGDVATWTQSNLTICGIGGRARLFAGGRNAQGKAIWVIAGSNVTVDSIEFRDATVPDQNGAGIRAEGGDLTVINSGFFDNETGILGGDRANITITRSEFGRNGYGDGQSHNLYIGFAKKLTVTSSYFHEAKIGHNLKSRAEETRIENSYFMDGPNGTSSYLAEFPNGGRVYLRGNMLHKGPMADNGTAVAHGLEGFRWTTNSLEMVHNTVVMTKSGGAFVSVPAGAQSVRLTANLFAGTGSPTFISGGFASGNVQQASNLISTASNFSGADSIASPNFWPNEPLRSQAALTTIPDAGYTSDSPVPTTLRSISGSSLAIGALQSAR